MITHYAKNAILFGFALLLVWPYGVSARDYRISVGYLPLYAEDKNHGILIDVIKAMGEEYTDGQISIDVFPFERSIYYVEQGQSDMHFPIVGHNFGTREDDAYEDFLQQRGLRRSTCFLTKSHFALYRNREHPPLDLNRLHEYRIETDAGHQLNFDIPMQGSTNLPGSIRKLSAGRIDGLVFAAREIDLMIREAGITNIERQDFQIVASKFILPDTPQGEETDRMLCEVISRMVRTGRLAEVARPYSQYFEQEFGDPYLPSIEDLEP
jgi:polar amino acid transport system substrate-binding protein